MVLHLCSREPKLRPGERLVGVRVRARARVRAIVRVRDRVRVRG